MAAAHLAAVWSSSSSITTETSTHAPTPDSLFEPPSPNFGSFRSKLLSKPVHRAAMAAAAVWSSLPGELVNLVADRLLATNDLDAYVDLRAVCHGWRSSTADSRGSPRDPRFQPRHWAMLVDAALHHNQTHERLFVNVLTGRFVRKNLPLLRRYFLVAGAAGGWLVLAERGPDPPHAAGLLNPFTGSLTLFMAPVPPELKLKVAAHVIGSSLTLLLLRHSGTPTIYWAAHPSSESFVVFEERHHNCRLSRQALIGGIFAGDIEHALLGSPSLLHPAVGEISAMVETTTPPFTNISFWRHDRALAWSYSFLVESAGEILIVFVPDHHYTTKKDASTAEVFKMATGGSHALERVKDIGNRAIFVGELRSFSVDADKFASVEANCVYYVDEEGSSRRSSYLVLGLEGAREVMGDADLLVADHPCPFSVVQLLCRYTSHVEWSQLGRYISDVEWSY